MTTPSLLVHIRHGHAHSFVPERTDREIPLSDEGLAHAERVGKMLYQRFGVFDRVIHSTYTRSKQTAYAQLKAYSPTERLDVFVEESSLLDERDHGATYGLTKEEIETKFPELDSYWQEKKELHAEYPEGTSLMHVVNNVRTLLDQLPPGERILLCGHWGINWSLRYLLEGLNEDQLLRAMAEEPPANCSLLVFEPVNGKLVLQEKNVLLTA